ncbi:MAG: EamA family transporter [Candidatus Moranbacteria bacterium]|nr:EamA family transporter [Candidatus Moranbacteria bacterium]
MLYVLLAVNIALMVIGQICFKKSSVFIEAHVELPLLLRYAQNAWFYAGITAFGTATIVWIKVLSMERLSAVYPMQSIAYILVAIASFFLFGERLNAVNIVGIFAIILGVILVSQR